MIVLMLATSTVLCLGRKKVEKIFFLKSKLQAVVNFPSEPSPEVLRNVLMYRPSAHWLTDLFDGGLGPPHLLLLLGIPEEPAF